MLKIIQHRRAEVHWADCQTKTTTLKPVQPNWNIIMDRAKLPHRHFIPKSSTICPQTSTVHSVRTTRTEGQIQTDAHTATSRPNRAKLPPPPASLGLGRFPRPTTSSGSKLGSHRRRLFGSGLRHPPWEEGTHKLSLQMMRNNRNVPVQKWQNHWKNTKKDTYTYDTINGMKLWQIIVLLKIYLEEKV